jgi:hypothetical protein
MKKIMLIMSVLASYSIYGQVGGGVTSDMGVNIDIYTKWNVTPTVSYYHTNYSDKKASFIGGGLRGKYTHESLLVYVGGSVLYGMKQMTPEIYAGLGVKVKGSSYISIKASTMSITLMIMKL